MGATSTLSALMQHAGRSRDAASAVKFGYVTSYDPNTYSVRVRLEPESAANESRGIENSVVETNWIPIYRPFGGNKWGFKAPPNADPSPPYGDQCMVVFPDGGMGMAFVGSYNNVENAYQDRDIGDPNSPTDPKPEAGEYIILHKSGSFQKFKNDGTIALLGKPQGLSGYPASAIMYLMGDGTIDIIDSENNQMMFNSKYRSNGNRITIADHSGNTVTWRDIAKGNLCIELKDAAGNFFRLRGNQGTQFDLGDTTGNQIKIGSDIADTGGTAGVKVRIADSDNDRLHFYGASGPAYRLFLGTAINSSIGFFQNGTVVITSGNGTQLIVRNDSSAVIGNSSLGLSPIVTLVHLQALVTQIKAALSGKQDGSGGDGGLVATASSTVQSAI